MNRYGRAALGGVALASVIVGCGARPSPTLPRREVPLHVHFAGSIACNAFPYGCSATLNVIGVDDPVDAVRPSATGIRWITAATGDTMFDSTPYGGVPAVVPGKHRLVISVLGSYDVASYDANGDLAWDLVSRCSADVDAPGDAAAMDVLVMFTPDPTGMNYKATCEIDVGPR